MSRFLLFCAVLCCGACGNSAGTTPVAVDDASDADSQISGTDAISDVSGSDATGTDAAIGTDAISDVSPGTDAMTPDSTPDVPDSAPDVPVTACAPTYEGSIPGATLDLSKTPCKFSISAAKGVFDLGYQVNVASAEKFSVGSNFGCNPQVKDDHGGMAISEEVAGGTQKWCLCDQGLCAPIKPPFTASLPGSYHVTFNWDGNNWYGPSDTGNKPGPAFPPGDYVFTVSISGDHQKADGSVETFSATAKLPITLTP